MTNLRGLLTSKARPPPASLPFKRQVTKQTTVKWSVVNFCNRNVGYSDRSLNEASVVIIQEG